MSFMPDSTKAKPKRQEGLKPAKGFLPAMMPSLMQLAGTTGLASEILFKAQQTLLNLPGSSIIHSISSSLQIPSSWQIVSHLLSINGAKSSKQTTFEGEQRARFNLKVASSRGAVEISARIVFRRKAAFLASENSRALIQIVVRVVNATGIQEHMQDIFICGTGKLKVRNRSGQVQKILSNKTPGALLNGGNNVVKKKAPSTALVPVFHRSVAIYAP